jgi:hypothetical protein
VHHPVSLAFSYFLDKFNAFHHKVKLITNQIKTIPCLRTEKTINQLFLMKLYQMTSRCQLQDMFYRFNFSCNSNIWSYKCLWIQTLLLLKVKSL